MAARLASSMHSKGNALCCKRKQTLDRCVSLDRERVSDTARQQRGPQLFSARFMDSQFFYQMVEQYGLYAVFFFAMIEGDITLLLAGVLAHSAFFGELSFIKVLCAGTLGAATSDAITFSVGRYCSKSVRDFRFYKAVQPRIEQLTDKFGTLSIFLSKYIYGLRMAAILFYGVGHMHYARFLPLALASCFLWVFILSGVGYFFSGAVMNLIGDFHQLGIYLLIIVVVGIVGFYLTERFWLAKKVEKVDPERIQELEHAAQQKLHGISHEIQEHIRRRPSGVRRGDSSKLEKPAAHQGKIGRTKISRAKVESD